MNQPSDMPSLIQVSAVSEKSTSSTLKAGWSTYSADIDCVTAEAFYIFTVAPNPIYPYLINQ